MTKVVLSIGTKSGVEKVPGSPKQHCKNRQFDWIEVSMKDLLKTGSLRRSLFIILTFRLLEPMHWLVLEKFG